jgi:glycopeptide antibiotics resistance protein
MKIILFVLVLACISTVFYFSWLPSPDLGTETYIPSWLCDWSNYYYNLRTAVPFVAIGFLLEMASRIKNPISPFSNSPPFFIQNISISAAVVCIAEGGQFFIQNRNPDGMDVFFGILGSGIGSLGYCIIELLTTFKKDTE